GALEKNFLLASGTGSGKTLVAYLAAVKKILEGKKVIYVVPLRALAFEKHAELNKMFGPAHSGGFKTVLSVGDYDSSDPWLTDYDIIICTYEKLDSLLRHRPSWLESVGLVIVDEIHELSRRPVVETLVTKLKDRQLLGLSATIGNVSELAEWMNADYVVSDFRPVPLKEGIAWGTELWWNNGSEEGLGGDGIEGVVMHGLKQQGQSLVFVNTRREAEALAEKLGKYTVQFLQKGDAEQLISSSKEILDAVNSPTRQCKRLAKMMPAGVAFHHAGLVNKQRLAVESAFRQGTVKTLVATVTLVAGLNLPSRRVILRNLKRMGEYWPVSIYKQAAGRAGRPGFDKLGEAVIIGKEKEFLADRFINGEPEPISSPLAHEPTLRKEIMGLFASGFAFSITDIQNFLSASFYAHQFGDASGIIAMGDRIISQLIDWGFLEQNNMLAPTKLGKRTAEVYLDPLTIKVWLDNFEPSSPLGYLHLACMAAEMSRTRVKKSEWDELMSTLAVRGEELLIAPPSPWEYEFDRYIRALKLALILEGWINEQGEDIILEKHGVSPGDLRGYISNAEWLVYGMRETVKIAKGRNKDLDKLMLRTKHGVKEELLELVKLPGIGRVRARRLKNMGIGASELGKLGQEKLAAIVGKKIAQKALQAQGF
ncbi:MAG: DEAD/DEAH box helicase, partial [Candidatus Altiarchaeota archaeon]|nr:DEAD/DEAH box helicase [Candidatus Altiarchaeota archaeon]